MSPAYLSKVENGEFPPPIEKKVNAIAKELGLPAECLLAITERVPTDVRRIICRHPEEWVSLIRAAGHLTLTDLKDIASKIKLK